MSSYVGSWLQLGLRLPLTHTKILTPCARQSSRKESSYPLPVNSSRQTSLGASHEVSGKPRHPFEILRRRTTPHHDSPLAFALFRTQSQLQPKPIQTLNTIRSHTCLLPSFFQDYSSLLIKVDAYSQRTNNADRCGANSSYLD